MAGRLREELTYLAYRAVAAAAAAAPASVAIRTGEVAGVAVGRLSTGRRAAVAGNLAVVTGLPANGVPGASLVDAAFASYGRYWAQSFRLSVMDARKLGSVMDAEGLDNLRSALSLGRGAILALPHLGDWDTGAAWLATQGIRTTVVAEALRPERLYRWFCRERERRGMTVVAAGAGAVPALTAALRRSEVVGLVSDRDLGGRGVPVRFFGCTTALPGGPAVLSLRCGAPIVPASVYQSGGDRFRSVMLPRLEAPTSGSLAFRTEALTKELAASFERLIAAAPEQWHMLSSKWRSAGHTAAGAPSAARRGDGDDGSATGTRAEGSTPVSRPADDT
ncbi:MAG: phosphatidylinositol mannoside acyltransferase [Actinomycetota bacterium]|nr:phosphatidylinositol mannoside acyltransferase [Actinomycetota bacterium]